MRIFLTGATGFIGSHVIPELLAGGHQVIGMTRSDEGAKALTKTGVEPHLGTLEEPETLTKGAEKADAVIHCAFDHNFSNFMANIEKDGRALRALAKPMAGKLLLFTSGVGMGSPGPGQVAREDVIATDNPNPRVQSEVIGEELRKTGVKVAVMRLPQVHDTHKQGLVTPYVMISKQQGLAGYLGDGKNVWSAGHVSDVARLYKLAIEQARDGERFNAVDEEGVSARDIAEVVAAGLGVPAVSLTPEKAAEHYGWLGHFLGLGMPASSAWTRERLGWTTSGPDLLSDLRKMDYSVFG